MVDVLLTNAKQDATFRVKALCQANKNLFFICFSLTIYFDYVSTYIWTLYTKIKTELKLTDYNGKITKSFDI